MNKQFIFISCGQVTDAEKRLGQQMEDMVKKFMGMDVFLAGKVQDLEGLDAKILQALRDCAGFITVLHPRGTVTDLDNNLRTRASVWIEQEIAVATYIQRLEKRPLPIIAFKHVSVGREGIRDLLQLNPIEFENESEVIMALPERLALWKDLAPSVIQIRLASVGSRKQDGHLISNLEVALINDTNQRITEYTCEVSLPVGFLKHWSSRYMSERPSDDPSMRRFQLSEADVGVVQPRDMVILFRTDYCPTCAYDNCGRILALVAKAVIHAKVWIHGREYRASKTIRELAEEREGPRQAFRSDELILENSRIVEKANSLDGVKEGTSYVPSASAQVAEKIRELVSRLNETSKTEQVSYTLAQKILSECLGKHRSQITTPLRRYFDRALDRTRSLPDELPGPALIRTAEIFLLYLRDAHHAVADKGRAFLQSPNLVNHIVLADYSLPVSKTLTALAEINSGKYKYVTIHLIESSQNFAWKPDTESWSSFLRQPANDRFYELDPERVTADKADQLLFTTLNKSKGWKVNLQGAERIYCESKGEILTLPAVFSIIEMARKHLIPVTIIAECYKAQPFSQEDETRYFGTDPSDVPSPLGHIDFGEGITVLTEHGVHVGKKFRSSARPLMCCHRYWLNQMAQRKYPLAVIFDLDGTLIDTENIHRRLYQEIARKFGGTITPDEYELHFKGLSDSDTFKKVPGRPRNVAELVQEKQTRFLRQLENQPISEISGASGFIRQLHKDHFLVALSTSASRKEADTALEKLKLDGIFDVVVTSDEVEIGKPDKQTYVAAAEALGVAVNECLVYEDSSAGIRSALDAGTYVVAVASPQRINLSDRHIIAFIDNFKNHELPEIHEVIR